MTGCTGADELSENPFNPSVLWWKLRKIVLETFANISDKLFPFGELRVRILDTYASVLCNLPSVDHGFEKELQKLALKTVINM